MVTLMPASRALPGQPCFASLTPVSAAQAVIQCDVKIDGCANSSGQLCLLTTRYRSVGLIRHLVQ